MCVFCLYTTKGATRGHLFRVVHSFAYVFVVCLRGFGESVVCDECLCLVYLQQQEQLSGVTKHDGKKDPLIAAP